MAASSGGTVSTGGSASSGGLLATGGIVSSGGVTATGGRTQSGGTTGSGGLSATGGASSTGGKSGSGGSPASGGTTATGGTLAPGGSASTGGATVSTGGATPDGGTTVAGGRGSGGATGAGGATGPGGTGPRGGTTGSGGATGPGGAMSKGGATATGGTTGSGGSTGACAGTAVPCPPTAANSIAYIGCSMADNIGQGYGQVGGKIMWTDANYGTGAMVVENWMEGGSAWPTFDAKLKAMGGIDTVKAFMVQICVLSTHSDANVRSMVKAARAKVNPGVHIYIVGQPQYEAGHTCSLAGTGGAEWTDTEAQAIAKDSTINQDLTYLGTFNLDTTKGESSDGCHASASGLTRLGNEAKAFWGN